jgi:hypothetical protein
VDPCTSFSHCATALVDAPARAAFDFLADPIALGRWALGAMNTRHVGGGVYAGTSQFDGAQTHLAIDARPELLLVDYLVGDRSSLKPRISARVVPAEVCGLGANQCYVTLIAWRAAGMSDARWQQLCAAHEAEILLVKGQIESRKQS